MEDKTFTQKEVEALIIAARERQETLEALECARIVMEKTGQYQRFIDRLNHIARAIEGAGVQPQEAPVEKNEDLFEETKAVAVVPNKQKK